MRIVPVVALVLAAACARMPVVPLVLAAACARMPIDDRLAEPLSSGSFADISASSGITAGNFDPDPAPGTVINDHSRLAFADLNGDRIDDIVMHSLFPNPQNGVPFEHLVFVGNGDGTFSDHSDASGLRDVQAAFFAFADVDNDGDQDLFAGVDIPELGRSAIYLNDGSGVFTELADAGVEERDAMAANAVFFDADADGVLDLFVGNGGTSYVGADLFYSGNGDGTFTRERDALPDAPRQPSNGSVTCDIDDDGDLDIVVSTYGVSVEGGANHVWVNDGGTFTEQGAALGVAVQLTGNPWLSSTGNGTDPEPDATVSNAIGSNGFGIDCADVTGDGLVDIVLATISHPVSSDYSRKWSDGSQLLVNQGPTAPVRFVNAWAEHGLPFNEGDLDIAAVDIDLDGQRDLSLSRESKYEDSYDDVPQQGWFGLLRADGPTFTDHTEDIGINDVSAQSLRMKGAQNHAWADVDADGDLDLLIGGRDQGGGRANALFENTTGQSNRHIVVYVQGDGSAVNRDGIGTVLRLQGDAGVRRHDIKSSRGMYNSEDTQAAHISLHGYGRGDTLTVTWPDGTEALFTLGRDLGDGDRIVVGYPDLIERL